MTKAKNNKWLRISLICLSVVVAGAVIAALWFSAHYKKVIRQQLPGMVAKATDSLYLVSLQDISINLLTRRITVSGLRLHADTARFALMEAGHRLPPQVFDIRVPQAEMRGISWLALLTAKELQLRQLLVRAPELTVRTLPPDTLFHPRSGQQAQPAMKRVVLQRIDLLHPRVRFTDDAAKADTSVLAASGSITLMQVTCDLRREQDTGASFRTGGLALALDSFVYEKTGGLYRFRTGAARFSSRQQELVIRDLDLRPAVSKETFYKRIGQQKEIYTLHFPEITIQQLAWQELLYRQQVFAAAMRLRTPAMTILMNRMLPPNTESKTGKFPHQLLQRLSLPVYIPAVHISSGKFTYTEINEKTKRAGDVPMRQVSGTISNVTNIPAYVRKNNICTIALHGIIMGGGDLQATFKLFLDSREGRFTVTGKHGPMDGQLLNPTVKALALARIESMQLTGMDLFVEGDEHAGRGRFSIRYKDLKVALEDVDEQGNMSRKGLMSFFANNVLLYSDNPMQGQPVRQVTTSVTRDPYKSFFNLIWKNIFEGALRTALRNEGMVSQINSRKAAQEQERRAAGK